MLSLIVRTSASFGCKLNHKNTIEIKSDINYESDILLYIVYCKLTVVTHHMSMCYYIIFTVSYNIRTLFSTSET